MEGKKVVASILPLARDLREIERRRSKKQGENPRLAGTLFLSRSCKKRGKKKTSPYIAKAMGPTT